MTVTECSVAPASVVRPLFRLLWQSERIALQEHLVRLNAEDRYRRFGAHLSDAGICNRVRTMQRANTVIVGAYVEGVLRGTAEVDVTAHGAQHRPAEVALTVERAFRGLGIGGRLFESARKLAVNRGATALILTTQADNRAMQRIARANGMHLQSDGAEWTASLILAGPTFSGWIDEWVMRTRSLLAYPSGSGLLGRLRVNDNVQRWWRGYPAGRCSALIAP